MSNFCPRVLTACLEELRLDYQDYLRQRGLKEWHKGDPRRASLVARRSASADAVALWVKEVHGQDGQDGQIKSMSSIPSIKSSYDELAANAALVLIGVASSLLDRQLATLATAFMKEGGFTERLYKFRSRERKSNNSL